MLAATGYEKEPELSQQCRHFEFAEILLATENFDESLVIGRGGFGKVYRGTIFNGSSTVIAAIKRLDSSSNQGTPEFWAEVEMLSKLRHCHLVSLFGYCNHEKEMILVYEYMPTGSLEDHLHKLATPISWLQRLKICIGTARGLDYLHTARWAQESIKKGSLKHIIDTGIRGEISPKCLKEFVRIAERCLHSDPKQRSTMAEVVVALMSVLTLQEKIDNSLQPAGRTVFGRMATMFSLPSIGENSEKFYEQLNFTCIRPPNYCHQKRIAVVISKSICNTDPNQLRAWEHLQMSYANSCVYSGLLKSEEWHSIRAEQVIDMLHPSSSRGDSNISSTRAGSITSKSSTGEGSSGKVLSGQGSADVESFNGYCEINRYKLEEVIGKGSSGVVCSAYDTHLGEKVAIKQITGIFENVSVATSILREIKLLRLLRHPDIVEVKNFLLPPSGREFKDIYLVFELMDSDLHQVIKANGDLTPEHHQFFLYQLLRGLKYLHTANVSHRDLHPKNILANADCRLKICDFGCARVAFKDQPTTVFWTDYIGSRWYRAPELCGSFYSKYTPAIDIWSIGCIFAEILSGRPLFPGKNVVHQLGQITDLLGTPSYENIAKIRNEKARGHLSSMRKKKPIPFPQTFPNADPLALRLLERMIAFQPRDRPSVEEALSDPYFKNVAKVDREPSSQPTSKLEFEFECRSNKKKDVRKLIYREILEYHPSKLKEFLDGAEPTGLMYPSVADQFKKKCALLDEHDGKGTMAAPLERQRSSSLPRACLLYSNAAAQGAVEVTNGLSKHSIKEV
ncbi:Mitogen-activated protein (MAP) kinase, conserved site-containing protein [Artemisia annua]|uniref:mitogen-activated protein kinase n=1 Tax=Artemisia annua TaxID=35608 RepID=A0A2U1M5E2_ARTAN|nr:Mitogen-activated protein (MAP) kinase, conserved site-containing protein [Artemisia annua]